MPRKRPIQLVGKKAAFNVEAWGRAVEALARQLQREWEQNGHAPKPVIDSDPSSRADLKPESAT
jgi:hypothetical protein